MTALEGTTLADQYFLKRLAGAGAMGQVYQAWDRKRSAYMAVKIIREPRFVESFVREAQALIGLAHPNIIRFYDAGADEKAGVIFIVMDWVDGKDLQSVLKKRNFLGVGEVAHILGCVQKALHYAHERNVCHCDIKPGNILIKNSDNQAILSDFGLAHVAHDQHGGGTLAFMAPELFNQDGKYSVSSDIYALGITLYQLLSGHLPFYGETQERLIQEHRSKAPLPLQGFNPKIPNGIVSVIEKALAKDPHHRQNSVTEMCVEFSKYARGKREELPLRHAPIVIGLRGEKTGQIIKMSKRVDIGRSKTNQLRLKHLSVSRYHAVIIWQQDRFFIRDNSSTVGTYINGRRLEPNIKVKIRDRDKIKIGVADEFEFREK